MRRAGIVRAVMLPQWSLRRCAAARDGAVFGAVGLAGFVTDVVVFNALRSNLTVVGDGAAAMAKVIAVIVAVGVTYVGHRQLTWRSSPKGGRSREISLFCVFNAIGMGIAVTCLLISREILGLDGAIADNVSANGFGLALGTAFRFWAYRSFVFAEKPRQTQRSRIVGDSSVASAPRILS